MPLFREVLKGREAKLGADHLDVADALNQLALALHESGQDREVVPLHERCLKIRETKLPPNHPDIAGSLNNLAGALWAGGHSSSAWRSQAKQNWQLADSALSADDRYGRTLALLERSLQITEANLGPDHPDLAIPLVNFASVLDATWRTLKVKERASEVGRHGENLARKRQGEREALFKRALKILETSRGADHSDVAECLDHLAGYYEGEGAPAQAEPLYALCLKIRAARLPATHPRLLDSLETLLRLLAAQDRWGEVADRLDDVNRRLRLHARVNLPSLAPTQQLAFLQRRHEAAFHRCLTLPFLRRDDKGLVARAAEWVLNGKAVAHEVRAEQAALIRDSKDPQAPEIARQLLALRAELDGLVRGGSLLDEAGKRRRDQLQQQEGQLVARLDLGAGPPASADPWVRLDAVRARIPTDAVLVEIVDFDLWDFKRHDWKRIPRDEDRLKKLTDLEKALSRYVAWVIPPAGKGEVRLVDLGDSWEIRETVEAFQKAMKGAVRPIQVDEEDAEREMRKHLAAIAARCLAPLEEHLAGSPRWIVSPDNHLWLVPWAALPLKDGSYAVEKHTISLVATGRDLLSTPAQARPGPALVLGDPDFDLGAEAAQREAAQLLPKERSLVRGPAGELTERVSRDWQRLFGTADEIKAVAPRIAAYTRTPPQVYTNARALETQVKAARGPRVLVLATHGFTLPMPPMPLPVADNEWSSPGRKVNMRVDDLSPVEAVGDPMVRCGLVLAGANKRAPDAAATADDGILTGVEVLGCDLRGTELVVLSACETGLGDVNLGEGVAGLRQAFQLAGARSVVASLWKVPDQESAALMTSFWDHVAAGKGKADALRGAQLARIKERRAREKAAHPFFWAAFTFTGDPR